MLTPFRTVSIVIFASLSFGGLLVLTQGTSGQTRESRAQKLAAVRAAGLYQNVDRTPLGANRECHPTNRPCPGGLRCVQINVTYRDGSAPYTTYRCENQFCPPTFIGLMLDGHPDKTSAEIIASLRDANDGTVDAELQCPAVNPWDPNSPNHNRHR